MSDSKKASKGPAAGSPYAKAEHVVNFRKQVLELIDDLHHYAKDWDWKYGEWWDEQRADIAATFDRRISLLSELEASETSARSAPKDSRDPPPETA